jgi:hypothetical protein
MNLPDRARIVALTNRCVATVRRYWPLLAVLLAGAGIGVAVNTSDDDHDGHIDHVTGVITTPRGTATITLGGQNKAKVALPPVAQTVAKTQAAEAAQGNVDAAHSDLRSEPVAAKTPSVIDHNKDLKPAGQPALPAHPPLATVNQPGCRTLLVRNQSSRNGQPVLLFVTHFTVSTDSGWTGVLGNVKWFDTSAAQASSNYIIDRKIGACAYTVPETAKAWAQAGFNSVSNSVEVTARGNEGVFLPKGPGRQRWLDLAHHEHQAFGLPYRRGKVSGCKVVLTGFVEHADLGSCGGGHTDTNPYNINDLISEAKATDPTARTVTSTDKVTCRKLNWWRTHGRPHGRPETNAVHRRKALASRHVVCTNRGPARR